MNSAWSRWLFGAWAVVAVVWVVVATLLLVQTMPEPAFEASRGTVIANTTDGSAPGAVMRGQASARAAPAVREQIKRFLLYAVLPPAFLFALVLLGLRIAGLPLPSLRRAPPLGARHGGRR
jgi:hypothetical protein